MAMQQELAAFLGRHQIASLPRAAVPHAMQPYGLTQHSRMYVPARPTAEQIAEELLGIAEFRALQLGTWLGTADGEAIAHAVELATPPFYRGDVALLVEGLKLAAALQHREGRAIAGAVAVGVVVVAGLLAVSASSK